MTDKDSVSTGTAVFSRHFYHKSFSAHLSELAQNNIGILPGVEPFIKVERCDLVLISDRILNPQIWPIRGLISQH